jgi:hypothetical protein
MADKTNLDGQKLMGPLDEFAEVELRRAKYQLKETPTKNRELVHVGMYFFSPILLLLLLMMGRSRR